MMPVYHLVGTECPEGQEERYHQWYAEHIRHLMQFEGLEGVQRFRRIGADAAHPAFLAIYRFRSLEHFREYDKGPLLAAAERHQEEFWGGPAVKVRHRVQYELIADFEPM